MLDTAPRTVAFFCLLFCLVVLPLVPVHAQQDTGNTDSQDEVAYVEQANELERRLRQYLDQAAQLESARQELQGNVAQVYERRVQTANQKALELAHELAQLVIAREAEGRDSAPYGDIARNLLEEIPDRIEDNANWLLSNANLEIDIAELSAVEQIQLEADRHRLADRLLTLYRLFMRNLELSEQIGIDVTDQADFLHDSLVDAAVNQSVALELARKHGATLSRQIQILPGDAELVAQAKVSIERVRRLHDTLRQLVEIMERRNIPVLDYRQQLATATGTITADILQVDVFASLLKRWTSNAGTWTRENLPGVLFNLFLFLLIVWVALTLSRFSRRLVKRGLERSSANLSQLLRRMIISSTGNLVLVLGLLFGLAQLGISIAPLLAGLGIAGFIVGFALQDTLGNFASGVLILIYRPYDVGDFIETNGVLGKVSRMSLVNTTVLTIDNQTLVLPNSKIWGDVIKNITAQRQRRVDMVFSIGYGDDIPRAEKVLKEIVDEHDKVLDDPAPIVKLHTLNESSVDFVVRPWVKTDDYWDVYWDITRAVKMRFDEQGISIPFPQRDVHLFTAGSDKGNDGGSQG